MERGFEKSWRLILITMVLMPLFSIIAGALKLDDNIYTFTAIGECVILIPTLIGSIMLKKNNQWELDIFKKINLADIPLLFVLPFFMQSFFVYLLLPIQNLLSGLMPEIPEIAVANPSGKELILQILVACLIPAVIEEFFCRGVIMQMLKPYGLAVSMLTSSIVFALLHFDLYSFLIIFMMGMLLSTVRIATGSIWACVLLHFANNLTAIINNFFVAKEMITFIIILKLLSIAAFPLCLYALLKKHKANLVGIDNTQKEQIKLTFDVYACIVLFLISLIITII